MNTAERNLGERRRTARVLAGASEQQLARAWSEWPERPEVSYLREPESGLVMVQARTGGTGDRFHLGEATATRATVAIDGSAVGTAYVLGSRPEHAALAAIFDGLLATDRRDEVLSRVIEPLETEQAERDRAARADARATVVDFFTVARENDGFGPDDDEDDE